MFNYYLWLGLRSLRRNPALTALMVLTLAIGVAASISTLTILHVMSGDPIPHKSSRLLVPMFDPAPLHSYVAGKPMDELQISYPDASNLLRSGQGARRTAIFDVATAIESDKADEPVIQTEGAVATADFFPMFDVPFLFGGAWSADDDKNAARVVVLSKRKSEALFGKENPVGKRIRMFSAEFQVIGVLDTYNPLPRFTHLINGNGGLFSGEDDILIPFNTAVSMELRGNGSTSCSGSPGPGYQGFITSECTWIQFWFETKSTSDRAALQDWLSGYAKDQRKLGRLPRPVEPKLFNVMEWMDYLEVVANDNKLAVWLAFGFLLLCLVNTMGLLLAKFSVRAAEVGVRRAVGATRKEIFQQFLVESSVIGMAGALLGLLLSSLSLWVIGKQSTTLSVVTHMDWAMLGLTILLAILASIIAGLLPTWRACQVTPALQLKSQ